MFKFSTCFYDSVQLLTVCNCIPVICSESISTASSSFAKDSLMLTPQHSRYTHQLAQEHFLEVVQPIEKHCKSLLQCTQREDPSWHQQDGCSQLHCSQLARVTLTFLRKKIHPSAMQLLVKILLPHSFTCYDVVACVRACMYKTYNCGLSIGIPIPEHTFCSVENRSVALPWSRWVDIMIQPCRGMAFNRDWPRISFDQSAFSLA